MRSSETIGMNNHPGLWPARLAVAAVLTALAACGSDPADEDACGAMTSERQRWSGNGHYYQVVLLSGVTWPQANDLAAALPGSWYLATVTSADESAFVEGLLRAGQPYFTNECGMSNLVGRVCGGIWLGALSPSASAQVWQWVTGEPFAFAHWGPLEPFRNGDRVRIDEFRDRGVIAWNDAPAALPSTGYIIETETLCDD